MPGVPNQETAHEALVRVCNEIDQDQSGSGGTSEDYAFIRAILQDVVVDAMFQTHDKLKEPMDSADHNANATVNRLLDIIDQDPGMKSNPDTREMFNLLADRDMQAVLMAHDDIARKSFEAVQYPPEPEPYREPYREPSPAPPHDADKNDVNGTGRIVAVRKHPDQPLGITVANDENGNPDELVVIRIAENSSTARQGLIHVGDVIAEVNGIPVGTSDQLGDAIGRSGPDIKFKVISGGSRNGNAIDNQRYLKTHFSYNPHKDTRISAPSLGLSFEQEDILTIIKDNDKNWWECKNLRTGQAGNIPSPAFEERRRQMTQPPPEKTKSSLLCGLGKKKKKSSMANPPTKQDQGPLILYEEVIKVKAFHHRCLVLVGAQGIGRRSIKNRLIQMMPKEFGAPTPNTSRPMRDGEVPGRNYHFLTREEMDADIKNGKYLEFGELNRNYYGTSLSALKVVIDSGRTCIIDPKSAALPKLRTVDWMPYVVFIKPTNTDSLRQMNLQAINDGVDTQRKTDDEIKRIIEETQKIQRQFIHFCDTSIPYDNFETACKSILQLLENADTTPQWVPETWDSVTERVPVSN